MQDINYCFLETYFSFVAHGIEVCHKSDSNFDKCMATQMGKTLELGKDGIPDLGIPKLEPFEIPKLEMTSDNQKSVSLDQKYEHILNFGLYKSEVYSAKFDMKDQDRCHWDFQVLTPYARMESDYAIKGKLLVFPINAHGRCNITLTNMRNHHQAWCERYQKNGKTHIRFTKYNLIIEADKVVFDFTDIIPGNEQLSAQILKTINENSQDIFRDTKNGFEMAWSALHLQTANKALARLTEDEAFPE